MEKFYLFQRWFDNGDVDCYTIKAEDIDTAWEIVEESYSSNNSQEWLLEQNSFEIFSKNFDEFRKTIKEEEKTIFPERVEEINEDDEASADLRRKYDLDDTTGEQQENFCN